MQYAVSAPFVVEFIDLDANERGIRTLRQRCVGIVEATDEAQAADIVRDRIRHEYPVCWQLRIGSVEVIPVSDAAAQERR